MRPIGILGGTFDPVHCGHLRLALEMRELLGLEAVRLLPAGNPRLRAAPVASAQARLAMLRAAIDGVPGLEIDARELAREGVTYSAESLEAMRVEMPDRPLVFLLGMDAFLRLPDWHRWEDLLELTHLAVARRPGASPPVEGVLAAVLSRRGADDPRALDDAPGGRIIVREITALDVSATRIRDLIGRGRSIRFLVPDAVHAYIEKENPYLHEH